MASGASYSRSLAPPPTTICLPRVESRAISLGYKTDQYKLIAFILSATLAGLAGSTKAMVVQIASLTDVNWPMSGEVVLMSLVGGLGTGFGPVA